MFSSHLFPSSSPKLPEAYSCRFPLVPDDVSNHVQITFDDFHLSSEYMQSSACDTQETDYLAVSAAEVEGLGFLVNPVTPMVLRVTGR